MTMAAVRSRLIDRLPPVRGRLTADAPLAGVTWFGVGGPAEVLFKPADLDDLAELLATKPADVPVTVLGVGSNLLVRDGGVPGIVLRLGRAFAGIEAAGLEIHAGAAALDGNAALVAGDAGIGGLEFLSGIPGTIGGGLRMNAGAYGREFKDVTVAAEALDERGNRHRLDAAELGFAYRHCGVPANWIFTGIVLRGEKAAPADIAARMAEIKQRREASQPVRTRTGGSTFANPPGHKAWELIDAAGCRGLRMGGAMVSEQHCNFLINTGKATAADIEALGEEVCRRVRDTSGITLEWEIRRIGIATGREA